MENLLRLYYVQSNPLPFIDSVDIYCLNCVDGFVLKLLVFKETLKFSYSVNILIILGYKMSTCTLRQRDIFYIHQTGQQLIPS